MPSLKDLLDHTLLFTGAYGADDTNIYSKKKPPAAPLVCPIPERQSGLPREHRPIWHWEHDPNTPAKVTGVKVLMGSMPMPVCTRVEVEYVKVVVPWSKDPISLPLTKDFVLSKYTITSGRMSARSEGWWQLPAEIDASSLVVFGYEIDPGPSPLASPASQVKALRLEDVERMGTSFFDQDVAVSEGDPDSPPAKICATAGEEKICHVSGTWVIVAFGFTTCKEAADFFPGKLLGTGRLYPHVMVTCNIGLNRSEAKIIVERPAQAMQHDPEMQADIGPILLTDTNSTLAFDTKVLGLPPIPLWSNFFDYYDLKPKTGNDTPEYLCVDPKRVGARPVVGAIQRESTLGAYESVSTFNKLPRQGEYDNLHLAPKMTFTMKDGSKIRDIAMAPFCVHDCLHIHFRWGSPMPEDPHNPMKIIYGFEGRKPYATLGAPLVPSDQAVWIRLTSPSSFTYRAESQEPAQAGTWTIFCHHGMGYALSEASPDEIKKARLGVAAVVELRTEPFTTSTLPDGIPVIDDIDPTASWAAFYQRLQWTGAPYSQEWLPRINILDLPRCRRS